MQYFFKKKKIAKKAILGTKTDPWEAFLWTVWQFSIRKVQTDNPAGSIMSIFTGS